MSHTIIVDVESGLSPGELALTIAELLRNRFGTRAADVHVREALAHGTRTKYNYDACRCSLCRDANTMYNAGRV